MRTGSVEAKPPTVWGGATVHTLLGLSCLFVSCGLVACGGPKAPPAKSNGKHDPDPDVVQAPAPPPALPDKAPPVADSPPVPTPDLQQALAYDPADPLADLAVADRIAAGAAPPQGGAVSGGTCTLVDGPRRLWPRTGWPVLTAVQDGFVVAGYSKDGEAEQVFVVHISGQGLPKPLVTLALEHPHKAVRQAAPGLAALDGHRVGLALADGRGRLLYRELRVSGAVAGGGLQELASGADTRFAPAVAYVRGRTLIAWTQGSTPMRTHVTRLDARGQRIASHDTTPTSMAAAAPTFVAGADRLRLLTIDPRDGMSTISKRDLSEEGVPANPEVAAVVGMVQSPTQLAGLAQGTRAFVAYTGLGSAATNAVGLVEFEPQAQSPEALVKGTAYGRLQAVAAASGNYRLLAVTAPTKAGKNPPQQIRLYRLGEGTLGEPSTVRGPAGDATHVALAAQSDGLAALAFSDASGVYFTRLRCGS